MTEQLIRWLKSRGEISPEESLIRSDVSSLLVDVRAVVDAVVPPVSSKIFRDDQGNISLNVTRVPTDLENAFKSHLEQSLIGDYLPQKSLGLISSSIPPISKYRLWTLKKTQFRSVKDLLDVWMLPGATLATAVDKWLGEISLNSSLDFYQFGSQVAGQASSKISYLLSQLPSQSGRSIVVVSNDPDLILTLIMAQNPGLYLRTAIFDQYGQERLYRLEEISRPLVEAIGRLNSLPLLLSLIDLEETPPGPYGLTLEKLMAIWQQLPSKTMRTIVDSRGRISRENFTRLLREICQYEDHFLISGPVADLVRSNCIDQEGKFNFQIFRQAWYQIVLMPRMVVREFSPEELISWIKSYLDYLVHRIGKATNRSGKTDDLADFPYIGTPLWSDVLAYLETTRESRFFPFEAPRGRYLAIDQALPYFVPIADYRMLPRRLYEHYQGWPWLDFKYQTVREVYSVQVNPIINYIPPLDPQLVLSRRLAENRRINYRVGIIARRDRRNDLPGISRLPTRPKVKLTNSDLALSVNLGDRPLINHLSQPLFS